MMMMLLLFSAAQCWRTC